MYKQEKHSMIRVLSFIKRYKTEHDGNSPSNKQIMEACGFATTSTVDYFLGRLEKQGKIRRPLYRRHRSIEVVGGEWRIVNA